jgi:DNA-binding GntR family transcriptional regulator
MADQDLEFAIEHRVPIREQVYERVSKLILTGRISPSERIAEAKLARKLGVSRTPVREALHVLEMEGFLDAIPRVGYQVKAMAWEEVEELCEIRKSNETLAVRWVAQRIAPEQLQALDDNLAASENDLQESLPRFLSQRDPEFHELLVQASGSRRLAEICRTLRRHMFLYRMGSSDHVESAYAAFNGHRATVERLRARDSAGAEKAVCQHLEFVKRDIREYAFAKKQNSDAKTDVRDVKSLSDELA